MVVLLLTSFWGVAKFTSVAIAANTFFCCDSELRTSSLPVITQYFFVKMISMVAIEIMKGKVKSVVRGVSRSKK
jgi:hypothetical protein